MRISGVDIPDHERAEIGLTRFFGIGRTLVKGLLKTTKIDPDKRVKDFTRDEVTRIIKALEDIQTEGDLKREIRDNIQRLKAIKCYRGIRHILNLPVRGQRTRVNARTRKGGKKTVGALTKEAWAKMEAQQKKASIARNK
jgi:small subunit ribosomal protein S13